MTRTPKRPKVKKLKRNPLARELAADKFRQRVVPRPDLYKRRLKHPKEETEPD